MRRWLQLALLLSLPAFGQSVTTVEVYGDVPAIQVYNGLGTNINTTNAWEYQKAQAIHMTWGRFDCGWTNVEATKGTYTFPSACSTGLSNGGTYGVHSVMDALYGPSWTTIATGTVTSNVSSGATTVAITVSTGSLSGVVVGQTELLMSPQWSAKNSYSGALIKGISGTTLTMAAAATSAFSAGTTVQVNLLFYPPVFVPPGQGYNAYQSNASVQAYAAYSHYLATQIVAASQTGQVSIWNEPPWGGDLWDQAGNLYDTPPPNGYIEPGTPGLGVELPIYLSNLGTAVAGVPLDNGYTEAAGWVGSLFFPNLVPWQENLFTLKSVFGSESFHPYGNNPEDSMWLNNSCLYSNLSNFNNIYSNCTPTGGVTGASMKVAVAASFLPKTFGGIHPEITETGICRCNTPTPNETQVARFDIRQFLGFQALGVTPIMFYRMYGDANWQWFTSPTTPLPVYTAFQGLMADIATVASSPVAQFSPCMMPRVTSFTGYYPLATATFVGSQGSNKQNSLIYYTWQRTYGTPWQSVTSPAAVNVSVKIPTGLTVSSVKDMVAGTTVSYTFASSTLTYPVTDNPIEAILVPTSSSNPGNLSCT